MTSKYVPQPVIDPGTTKVRKVTLGLAATNDVPVTLSSGGATYNLFDVASGVVVRDVFVDKRTAFASSSGVVLTIGMDSDPDSFILSSGLTPKSAGFYGMVTGAANPANKSGYRFGLTGDTSTHITASLSGKGPATAGQFDVYLVYFDSNEL